ncbi:MAG: transposase [Collinsella sp.]|nr:transposase [Collinsella sp.]
MQNESTPGARGPVFCGVDTHADSHWLCVLDWRGRKVLSRQFPADAAGYEALAGAIAAAGEPACVAMEGTSSYGAGLTRHLASLGMPVREALSPARMQRRRPGVSVNVIFTISTNAFSPIAPTRIRRIRQRGCAAFGA